MKFVYDADASHEVLAIKDENYRYLFKVKRLRVGDIVHFRNLKEPTLYSYKIIEVGKKEALLKLESINSKIKSRSKTLHLIWCVIDPKVIYATLPMLNQLGVSRISFVYCERSQKNFKIDLFKVKKIIINSCQQSGRSDLMNCEIYNNFDDMYDQYGDFTVLDFGGETTWGEIPAILIGCEGGFSENERKKLQNNNKIGLKTDFILKSETAALCIASKLLI